MKMVLNKYYRKKTATIVWLLVAILVQIFVFTGDTVYSANRIKVVILGDSLTAGYGLKKQDAFPFKLAAALKSSGRSVQVINAGVSGDTSAGGRSRLSWALTDNPQLVIIELGANDGLRGLDPSETKANLNAVLNDLKKRKIKVLLTGMLAPPNLGKEYSREFGQIFPELAKTHAIAFYKFFLEGIANYSHLNQMDGIHPNPAGVDEIVRRILPIVKSLIDTVDHRESNQN